MGTPQMTWYGYSPTFLYHGYSPTDTLRFPGYGYSPILAHLYFDGYSPFLLWIRVLPDPGAFL